MDVITHALSGAAVGAACAPSPQEQPSLMLVGAIAGVAPDLDALCEAGGKLAAWRYHRVLLHGLPTLPFQALLIYAIAQVSLPIAIASTTLLMVVIAALVTHLVLDTVTSFGTVLAFPLNRRRFSTHSHFIFDPFIFGVLSASLLVGSPSTGIALSIGGLISGWAIRQRLLRLLHRTLKDVASERPLGLWLEPGLLAPFRWLAIVRKAPEVYALARISWRGHRVEPWTEFACQCDPHLQERARQIPLVQAFLATAHCPLWSVIEDAPGAVTVILEDLKWRTVPPFRPLAFRIRMGPDPRDDQVEQLPLSWRGPSGRAKATVQ